MASKELVRTVAVMIHRSCTGPRMLESMVMIADNAGQQISIDIILASVPCNVLSPSSVILRLP